jgi:hypothetical protein
MRFVHHRAPRWMFATSCLVVTAACTTLRPVEPDELRGSNPPDRVRVTKTDDSTLVLHTPKVVGDTLIGFVDDTRRAFPLSQTTAIDTWAADPGQTAAAVIFGGGLGAMTFLVIRATSASSSPRGACTANCPPGVTCCAPVASLAP